MQTKHIVFHILFSLSLNRAHQPGGHRSAPHHPGTVSVKIMSRPDILPSQWIWEIGQDCSSQHNTSAQVPLHYHGTDKWIHGNRPVMWTVEPIKQIVMLLSLLCYGCKAIDVCKGESGALWAHQQMRLVQGRNGPVGGSRHESALCCPLWLFHSLSYNPCMLSPHEHASANRGLSCHCENHF